MKKVKQTISTFIIVKDEEETILKSLESAAKFSDEIVIGIDDTSTDKTEEIVNNFDFDNKFIYKYTWTDSFAAARNTAIEKCKSDWIFKLDAHEYVYPGHEEDIISAANGEFNDGQYDAIAFSLLDEIKDGIPGTKVMQHFMWKRSKKIFYNKTPEYAMHNELDLSMVPEARRIFVPNVYILHERSDSNSLKRQKQRAEMGIKIFGDIVKKDPNNARALFYLADTYANHFDYKNSLKYYKKYMALYDKTAPHYDGEEKRKDSHLTPRIGQSVSYKLALLYQRDEKHDEALKWLFKSLQLRGDSPEVYHSIGLSYLAQENYKQAERFLKTSLSIGTDHDHHVVKNDSLVWQPYDGLCKIYFETKDWEMLRRAGTEGHRANPAYQEFANAVKLSLDKLVEKIPTPDKNKKKLYIVDETGEFSKELAAEAQKHYNVIYEQFYDPVKSYWSDITFVEWGWRQLMIASQFRFTKRLIGRVHRFDVFSKEWKGMNWNHIDHIIYTSGHVKKWGGEIHTDSTIIENAVRPEKYPLLKEFNDKNLVIVGKAIALKNMHMIIDQMKDLPGYHLHIAGKKEYDENFNYYLDHLIESLGLEDRIHWHGWQPDINAWLEEIKPKYIISGSIIEGLPYSILEAMSKGIQPCIYNYTGSKKQFRDFVFDRPKDLKKMLDKPHDPDKLRKIIERRYSFEREYRQFREVVDERCNK